MAQMELRLTTLTPLHIGGQEVLQTGQFAVMGGYVYVLSERKFLDMLKKRGLLERFLGDATAIINDRAGLKNWLERYRLWNDAVLQEVSLYRCKLQAGAAPGEEIRTMTRDPMGNPQIFGTSVKGALRTVVLYHLAKAYRDRDPQGFTEALNRSLLRDDGRPKDAKYAGQRLVEQLLANFSLGRANPNLGKDAPHKDYLKVLKVGDAQPFSKDAVSVVTTTVKSAKGSGDWYDKVPVAVEAVDAGQQTTLRLVLDEWLVHRFQERNGSLPFTRLEDLCTLAAEFHEDWVAFESEFYRWVGKPVPPVILHSREKPVLHLGWGSGLAGITLLMLLPEKDRQRIREMYFEVRDVPLFPKSRRLGPGDVPLGLVELEMVPKREDPHRAG